MNKVIAYGCVVSGFHSTKAADKITNAEAEWRLHTKVADEVKKIRNMFVSEDIIRIDVIDSFRKHRKHLEEALRTMSYGDTIIIASLSSLGLNNDELVENYKSIFNAGIGLLVPDYKNENGLSVFATTDYSFSALSISEEEFKVLCNQLSFQTITSLRGRKKLEVTDEFKEIYWKYERYAIDPGTACKNKFYAISKNTFRRLCDVYEKSKGYEEDLEEQESRYNIHEIPKRHGVISPELEAMIHTVAGGADFEDACALHGITINLTHFMRIYAKFYMPKKFIVKLTNDRRDYDLIESLQPSYDKT
ncbi:MAG: hypothetical protein IKK91_03220 [Ruminococcus sp.]|nr:hypothetical protein [Ruminococcus sp.]